MPDTQFYKDWKLAHAFSPSTAPAIGSTRALALFSTAPTQAGGGTEITTGGIGRIQLLPASIGTPSTVASTTNRTVSNTSVLAFQEAIANTPDAVAWGLFDGLTGTNLLSYGTIPSRSITTGITPQIAIGSLVNVVGDLP